MSDVELPPLPEPNESLIVGDWREPGRRVPLYVGAKYTADQMRAYGRQCYEAALEAAARIADAPKIVATTAGDEAAAEQMSDLLQLYMGGVAEAIRAMKSPISDSAV